MILCQSSRRKDDVVFCYDFEFKIQRFLVRKGVQYQHAAWMVGVDVQAQRNEQYILYTAFSN